MKLINKLTDKPDGSKVLSLVWMGGWTKFQGWSLWPAVQHRYIKAEALKNVKSTLLLPPLWSGWENDPALTGAMCFFAKQVSLQAIARKHEDTLFWWLVSKDKYCSRQRFAKGLIPSSF
jgi:hypothetical protein